MRIIKFLLGSILLTVAAGCGSSIGQSTVAVPTTTPDDLPVAAEFVYPVGKGARLTEAKDATDDWYNARNFGESDHLGEDWNKNSGGDTDCGEPVFAVAAGRIVYAENGGPGWGNVVIIEHLLKDGKRIQSLYGHLRKIEKTSGLVQIREKIGEVGNADGRYLCHLHLEIRERSCPVWSQPGPGYAKERAGWVDPSEFIDGFQTTAAKDILAFYDPLIAEDDLEQRNSINEFSKYDFSVLWAKSTELLGFIGEDYRRIIVRIRSVKIDSGSQSYVVRGESVLGDKTSPLQGTFRIDEIRRLTKMHWGVDDELKNSGMKAQGALTGDYDLSGDSGTFKGRLSALWFLDRAGRIRFDDIERYADPYRNNQFVGFWSDGKERLRSNWGDFRIPDSGDLDIGAGHFSPDEKYLKNGWESYRP